MADRTRRNRPARGGGPPPTQPAAPGQQVVAFVISLVLVVMVFVVFGQTLGHEFVNYDDGQYVFDNPRIANGLSLDGIQWAFTHVHADNWHPVTTIAHMFNCQLYGIKPWGHHLTNVLLHAVTAVMLFFALRELTNSLWPSAAVAAAFAIHPLRVGSVAWASELKDILSGLFFMLILWTYARYARNKRPSTAKYATVIVLFAVGLMCKPTLVTVPFVLLLLDYWPLRRFPMSGDRVARTASSSPSRRSEVLPRFPTRPVHYLLVEKIPFFVLSAGSCLATILAQERAVITMNLLPFGDRVANALMSYVAYVGQMIWPVRLSAVYPYPENGFNIGQVFLALTLLLIISVAVFIWRGKYPYLLIGWLWFLGMLVPMIGVIQVGAQARADRYTYLSQIGLYILVVWGAVELFSRWGYGRTIIAVLGSIILTTWMAVAYHETTFWQNSEILWNHALANTTNNHIALTNMGDVLIKKGRLDEATDYLRKALVIYPNSPEANNDLGYALANKGNWSNSIEYYRAAMKVRPNYSKAHNNLAISLSEVGKKDEALAEFHEALKIDDTYADAHCNLGALLLQLGRKGEAIAQLNEALRLKPDDEEVRTQLRQLGVQR